MHIQLTERNTVRLRKALAGSPFSISRVVNLVVESLSVDQVCAIVQGKAPPGGEFQVQVVQRFDADAVK